MTKDELVIRLRAYFENDIYYTSTDFTNSIQDGYDEVIAFTGLRLKATNITPAANVTYWDMITLIPDFIGLVGMYNQQSNRWMLPTSLKKLEMHRDDWNTEIGTPEYFTILSHRYVAIYRKPSVSDYGQIGVYYAAAAPTLNGSDTILIDSDHLKVLEDYCITDLQEQQQEWSKAGRMLESYTNGLERLRIWSKNQRSSDRIKSLR